LTDDQDAGATIVDSPDDSRLHGHQNGIIAFGYRIDRPTVVPTGSEGTRAFEIVRRYGWRWQQRKLVQLVEGPVIRPWAWVVAVMEGRDPLVGYKPFL
jgi:hypothetical protein